MPAIDGRVRQLPTTDRGETAFASTVFRISLKVGRYGVIASEWKQVTAVINVACYFTLQR